MNVQAPRDFIDRRQLLGALRALRRGDFSVRLPEEVDGVDGEIAELFNEVVGMNEALTSEFERLARVVEMRYFGGLSEAEIAECLGLTERTVQRDWQKARLFLSMALR